MEDIKVYVVKYGKRKNLMMRYREPTIKGHMLCLCATTLKYYVGANA